jgi:hypothetical protein
MSKPRILHIVSNSSAAETMRGAFDLKNSEILNYYDCLDGGRLINYSAPKEWFEVRAAYLGITVDWNEPSQLFASIDETNLDSFSLLNQAEEIYLWAAAGEREQLFMLWFVSLCASLEIDLNKLRLIDVCASPRANGQDGFRLMGLMSAEQLIAIRQQPTHNLTGDDVSELQSAWLAITDSTPEKLSKYCEKSESNFPVLKQAMLRFQHRYPDSVNGLSIADAALIFNCATKKQQAKASLLIGMTMGQAIDAGNCWSDFYLFWRLKKLGDVHLAHPAVRIFGSGDDMKRTEVQITDMGHKFLNSEENFVKLNGIDDWVGGVHLTTENQWFLKNDKIIRM